MKKATLFTLNLDYGGIERYVATLANMFHNDYEVEIISTFKTCEKPAFEIPDNVKITYLINEKPDDVSIKKLLKRFKVVSACREIKRRKKLSKLAEIKNKEIIENLKTDIIITSRMYHSHLINKYCRDEEILKIATDHNFHQNKQEYINELIESVKTFDYLVTCTNELYNDYKDLIGNTKCKMIYNSIPFLPELKTEFKNKNLIAVGRFSPEKGFLDLIDVMELIVKMDNQFKLYLLGDGFQKDEIISKIEEKKLKDYIITPGFKPQHELETYFLDSSLFVMTSFTEAFGLVLIEAMSYGLPCIAFDSASGARELIKDNVGILIPNRDKEKMAKRIVNLVKEKKELLKYQTEINKYIIKFTIPEIEKEWNKLLKEGLGNEKN